MSHHENRHHWEPGPYGLSLAAHLRHHGLSYELFWAADCQSWSDFMPKGMPAQIRKALPPTSGIRSAPTRWLPIWP